MASCHPFCYLVLSIILSFELIIKAKQSVVINILKRILCCAVNLLAVSWLGRILRTNLS